MAKKKVSDRISPNINTTPPGVTYSNLYDGDCFIWGGRLWIKSEVDGQEAINLADGDQVSDMCDEVVIPVDVKITWKVKG